MYNGCDLFCVVGSKIDKRLWLLCLAPKVAIIYLMLSRTHQPDCIVGFLVTYRRIISPGKPNMFKLIYLIINKQSDLFLR